MNAIIVGTGSEIARNIAERLERDGWHVSGCSRESPALPEDKWDLLLLCRGTMEPIGKFFDCDVQEWEKAIAINALDPLRALRNLWDQRKPGANVVFLGGPNTASPTATYSAYRSGKIILESLVSTLYAEYPEHGFYVLHPGVVRTKIHQQTITAGDRAANIDRVRRIVSGKEKTVTHDKVYFRLLGLIA